LPIAALEGGNVRRLAASELSEETMHSLFWRRSGTDLKLRVPSMVRGRVSQRLMHGGAALGGKSPPVRH